METNHSYHAFIMQMCMMKIFLVCFLHVSCSRLIQPVEVYINWYMMWYQKICSAGNISLLTDASFFERSVHCLLFGWSGHHSSVWSLSIIHRTRSKCNLFVHSVHAFVCTLIFMIVRMIVLTIVCTIVCMLFFHRYRV